jgi:hypothetical protein
VRYVPVPLCSKDALLCCQENLESLLIFSRHVSVVDRAQGILVLGVVRRIYAGGRRMRGRGVVQTRAGMARIVLVVVI